MDLPEIQLLCFKFYSGGVPERLNGTVSKIVVGATPPRVRIPAPPPSYFSIDKYFDFELCYYRLKHEV